jgi:hypothetical protein
VDHVEVADIILRLKEVPDERAAHLLHFVHDVAIQVVGTVVIPDSVNPADSAAVITGRGENVNFVAAAFQRHRQFRHVRRYPSHRVGV